MLASGFSISLLLSCFGALLVTTFAIEEFEEIEDSVANTVLIRGSDTSVRVQADSGKISVVHFEQEGNNNTQEDFGDDNTEVLSFQVESLQERSSSGAAIGVTGPSQLRHFVGSFKSHVFNLSSLDNSSTFQGIPVKNVNLKTFLSDPQAHLELMVWVFLGAGIIRFGNETFAVQNGTMKFNIKISDWPFCGTGNVSCLSQTNQREIGQFLDLALSIRSQVEEPEEVNETQRLQSNKAPICVDHGDPNEQGEDCPIIYNMGGNSEMLLNRGVMTNSGDYVALPPGFPKFETTGMRSKRLIFRIPRFNNTVIIDPSVNLGDPKNTVKIDPSVDVGGPRSASTPTTDQESGARHNNAASSLQFFSFALLLSVFTVHY